MIERVRKRIGRPVVKPPSKRDTLKIKAWLLEKDIQGTDLARAIETSTANVSATICGRGNSRKVLWLLVKLGCPVEYLDLPADMQEAA